jgi:hypothetical protein
MTFPQPLWNLFGCFRESERERLFAEMKSSEVKHQIKHEPGEAKPYSLWVHDDHLQLAADTLLKKPR